MLHACGWIPHGLVLLLLLIGWISRFVEVEGVRGNGWSVEWPNRSLLTTPHGYGGLGLLCVLHRSVIVSLLRWLLWWWLLSVLLSVRVSQASEGGPHISSTLHGIAEVDAACCIQARILL